MPDINLKKLSRAELLEMMISFSEEAEAAKRHEQELREQFEREKLQLQHEMAEERAAMLKSFDDEKAEMRAKFNQQKDQMQAKFDKDIEGLKARLEREKQELVKQVDDQMDKIQSSGTLAEASLKLGGVFEAGQKAVDLYVQTLQDQAKNEYEDFKKQMVESQKKIALMEAEAKKRCDEMLKNASGESVGVKTTEEQTLKEETTEDKTTKEETAEETPKKSTTKKSVAKKDDAAATQTGEQPVKRKRGRPRKIRVDE
ncbi:hypothetical protein [Butyrivibrio sp. MC2021]|uniref:hypothetical protein n=1 Tax=Butyrivibrio sp. MC2021 TaxID=1408306 RepID=UPI000684FEE8|nr:hypothetical protein [Butyrivibrio sp. MC2021]